MEQTSVGISEHTSPVAKARSGKMRVPGSGGSRFRCWLFTCFNVDWELPAQPDATVRYVVYQWERAPDTGRKHAQGYAEFTKAIGYKKAQSLLGIGNSHCERRCGSAEQAISYCSKEDTRWDPDAEPSVYGSPAGLEQGKRTDLSLACDLLKEGKSCRDVALELPESYVKYYRGFSALQTALAAPALRDIQVFCYWGPTGTGKTHKAVEAAGVSAYWKDAASIWWDGYFDQAHVIIDEVVPNRIEHGIGASLLLRWLDKYPVNVQTKGGYVALQATKIWLTSNYNPTEWLPAANSEALVRRMTVVEELTEPYEQQ